VTSQSPADEEATEEYRDAWSAINYMTRFQGASWSGRERNCAYLNLGGADFANVSAATGADFADDGRCAVALDWDADGRRDLLLRNRNAPRLRLMRNVASRSGGFLTLRLQAAGSNRDAIGALVEVEVEGGRKLRRRVYASEGYLAQPSRRLHFGLRDAPGCERLRVSWPDGEVEEHAGLGAGRHYLLVQGAGPPRAVELPGAGALDGVEPAIAERAPTGVRRVVLTDKLPMSALTIPSFEDARRRVSELEGRPVLINLWATWCRGCRVELAELQERRADLDRAGLVIVPLTTDEGAGGLAKAREAIRGWGFEEHAGYADGACLQDMEVLLVEVLGRHDDLPMPTSFLLDGVGQLAAVYLGPPGAERILADVEILKRMETGDGACTALSGGRWLSRGTRDLEALAEVFQRIARPELADWYRAQVQAR